MKGQSSTTPAAPPLCPRCGYDQSGVVGAWRELCPLRGTCSECGHVFDFARVINAEQHKLSWLYEHTPRGLGIRRAWYTWQRMVLPWRFWREHDGLRLDSPFVGWRLGLWLPSLIASLWILGSTTELASTLIDLLVDPAGRTQLASMNAYRWLLVVLQSYVSPAGRIVYNNTGSIAAFNFQIFMPYPAQAWLACCLLMPVLLLTLSASRAMVKIRAIHVFRAAIYGAGVTLALPIFALILSFIYSTAAFQQWYWSWSTSGVNVGYLQQSVERVFAVGGGLLGIAWFAAWWWIVLIRVFALPNGRFVWAMLMVACLLAALIAACLNPSFGMLLIRHIQPDPTILSA